jgi:hypothetical protein
LQFQLKNSRLTLARETPYGERAQETTEENAQAQVQKAAPASKVFAP